MKRKPRKETDDGMCDGELLWSGQQEDLYTTDPLAQSLSSHSIQSMNMTEDLLSYQQRLLNGHPWSRISEKPEADELCAANAKNVQCAAEKCHFGHNSYT